MNKQNWLIIIKVKNNNQCVLFSKLRVHCCTNDVTNFGSLL